MKRAHGRYHGLGWVIDLSEGDVPEADRLTSIHETWHDRLQFTTMYGLLVQVLWVIGAAASDTRWSVQADALLAGAVRTHEEFAAWMTERVAGQALAALREAYPIYASHADRAQQRLCLVGSDYDLMHAANAVYRGCMQSAAVATAIDESPPVPLERLTAATLSRAARPDYRLRVLTGQLRRHGWGAAAGTTHQRSVRDYVDQDDADWDRVSRGFYDRCVALLAEAGCPTLPYEGQLARVEMLHERAVRTVGRPIRLVPASASTEGAESDVDVALRALEGEQLRLRTPMPAAVAGTHTPMTALISGRGDQRRHLFVAIRPAARLRRAYTLHGAQLSAAPFLAVLRSSSTSDGLRTVTLMDVTELSPVDLAPAGVPVLTSVSMCTLADDAVRQRWGPLLTVEASTVLVDLSPTRHLRLWLNGQNHLLRYAIVRYQAVERIVVAVVWQLATAAGSVSRLHIALVTPTYAAALEVWLDSHPQLRARAVRDDGLVDRNEALVSTTIGHLLAEEPSFDFQAGADT